MKKKKEKSKKIIHIIILTLIAIMILASYYVKIYFANETIEEFLFYLTNGVANGDIGVYVVAVEVCLPFLVILLPIFVSLFYNILIDKEIILHINKFNIKIYPIEFIRKHKIIGTIILFVLSLALSLHNIKIEEFFESQTTISTFIQDNYHMDKNDISFETKRNLIYIVSESLETTMFTKEQGGNWDYEVIPELYRLLYEDDSIFFSANELATGRSEQVGANFTTAGLVSTSSGLPFKIPINGNHYYSDNFMSGAYTLGDVLKENGYYQELITSASSDFGGIRQYFTKHGKYEIIDGKSYKAYDINENNVRLGKWGLTDKSLFDIAKERLEKISKQDKPFNLELVTIDTHPNDGYVGDYTVTDYQVQYDNVYRTQSILIYDFISWVKKQDFYKDTTIVITGDHLNMQTEYFKNRNTNRYIYDVIINPVNTTTNTKNRIFTAVDIYPTIVSAIGGKINGEQLALGVNLFSDKPTLAEQYGIEEFNKELYKNSPFYNSHILGKDYYEMAGSRE